MSAKTVKKEICPIYEDYITNWDYKQYLSIGGYGSGKSYHTALKLVLKLFCEKRKALVVRETFGSIQESCYDLICNILNDMDMLTYDTATWAKDKSLVLALKSPLSIIYHNGSRIIFKGLDKIEKLKSINDISIIWIEECTEISRKSYIELLGRIRSGSVKNHMLMTCNPIGKESWVYSTFFRKTDTDTKGRRHTATILNEEHLYNKKILVKNNVYYMHTVPEDNIYLSKDYIKTLDELKGFDEQLWEVARLGHFGITGTRVLPQLVVAESPRVFKAAISALGNENKYYGFDFGFEKSYNAVVSMAVDNKHGILYIYDEIYVNNVTDNVFAMHPKMLKLKDKLIALNNDNINKQISADNEDPKAISYYRQCGYPIRKCRCKFSGSRLSNTRKVKRFKRIIVSPKCVNVISELQTLTYKTDKNGNAIYDEFNIDPHTFSAIWYGLDTVTVADLKDKKYYSKNGDGGQ